MCIFKEKKENQLTEQYNSPDEFSEDYKKFKENEASFKKMGLSYERKKEIEKKVSEDQSRTLTYWSPKYTAMGTDWDFYDGDNNKQWAQEALDARKGRPTLTINHCPKFVKSVVGESKKNPPAIKINPRSSEDKLKADIGSGIVRYIEDCSGASVVYNYALKCAAIGGLGWWRILVDKKAKNPAKRVRIKRIKDAFEWYMDPDAEEPDGSDSMFFFNKKESKEGKKSCTYSEHWWKEEGEEEDRVFWAILKNGEVQKYGEWYTGSIPIYCCLGEDIQYQGNRTLKGVIRNLQDVQRVYNYNKSQETEEIALKIKNGVIAQEGQLEGYEDDWVRAQSTPVSILYYKNVGFGDEPAPPPAFASEKVDTSWAPVIAQGAAGDMREITGIYDTALGAESKELSGKAIEAKQSASDSSQYDFTESLQTTLSRTGWDLIELIPEVYKDETVITILGEDGKQNKFDLNRPIIDPVDGQPKMIDITDFSEYDISISTGPAYATRRQAGSEALKDLMKALPEKQAMLISDLTTRSIDAPYMDEAADRLYNALPEEVKNPPKPVEPGMVPQEVAGQMMASAKETIETQQKVIQELRNQTFQQEQVIKKNADVELAKNTQDNSTKVFIERMKQAGSDERQRREIFAEFEKTQMEIAADAQKSITDAAAGIRQEQIKQDGENRSAAMQQDAPNSVTISNTKVDNVGAPPMGIPTETVIE